MKLTVENKTEKALRERQNALVLAQGRLSRIEGSLRVMHSVFLEAKKLNRDTWFCNLKRRAAQNARYAYDEWQSLWAQRIRDKKLIAELETEIKRYDKKLQKTKEYNERRRKRRAEKKQVSQ